MAKRFNYQLATVLPKHAARHVDKSRFEQLELGTLCAWIKGVVGSKGGVMGSATPTNAAGGWPADA